MNTDLGARKNPDEPQIEVGVALGEVVQQSIGNG